MGCGECTVGMQVLGKWPHPGIWEHKRFQVGGLLYSFSPFEVDDEARGGKSRVMPGEVPGRVQG